MPIQFGLHRSGALSGKALVEADPFLSAQPADPKRMRLQKGQLYYYGYVGRRPD
jgi:hypothetical protein